MDKFKWVLTALIFAALLGCSDSSSNTSDDLPIEATLEQTLDTYLSRNIDAQEAGLAALVIKDDVVVYRKGVGMANIPAGMAVTTDTGFRLASLSKPFTAIAVMQLHEQGLLSLNDSIRMHMPEFDESWQGIQVQHLLSHRSGIYDYLNDVGDEIGYENMTNQRIIDYFVAQPALAFEPGTQAKYINTGFLFLAEIVSRVSGMAFSDYMANYVFQPAGMEGSYINDEVTELKLGDALNYGDRDTWYGTHIYTYGASGQVSSIDDMALFIYSLKNFELISEASFESMTQPYSQLDGYHYGYGFGLNLAGLDLNPAQGALWRYGHGGSHDGYRSRLTVDLAENFELVLLANNGELSTRVINDIRALVDRFYGATALQE